MFFPSKHNRTPGRSRWSPRVADVHDRKTRSRNMAAILSKNTNPEKTVRSALFRSGLRFRLHARDLPGSPDLVFPRYRAAVFVHGCFFHAHDCEYFKWPSTNAEFWRTKILGNRTRDDRNIRELRARGWRTFVIWECELKRGQKDAKLTKLASKIREAWPKA